jgi:DNA-binding MarR family transcriptional regulator
VTLIIQKLKTKKLVSVERSEEDSRHYIIQITKAGLNLLAELDIAAKPHLRLVNNLTEAEAVQLNYLLDKLRG